MSDRVLFATVWMILLWVASAGLVVCLAAALGGLWPFWLMVPPFLGVAVLLLVLIAQEVSGKA